MRYLKLISGAVCLAMLLTSLALAADTGVTTRMIVQADSPAKLQHALDDIGGEIVAGIPESRSYLVRFPKSASLENPTYLLKGRDGINLTRPEAIYYLPEVNQISIGFPDEDDPELNAGVSPPMYFGQPGIYATGIDSAQVYFDGAGIVVAIIDNGVDFSHPLFADANFVAGYDFVDNDSIPAEEEGDLLSHGTFVTGLIRLTAPEATIMPLRVFNEFGNGNEFDVVQAIYHAINNGADVINMSFSCRAASITLMTAIADAHASGIVMLASVGNEQTSVDVFPAALPGVVAVSAIDTLEYLASFSSYGDFIDVSAPGVRVYSAFSGEHEWGTWSGTSFSVALVTGTAILTMQAHPEFGPLDLEAHLRATARTDLDWGVVQPPSVYWGYGVVNAHAAVLPNNAGDLDGSGNRDMADLTLLLRLVGAERQTNSSKTASINESIRINRAAADLNSDGTVDDADISAMVAYMFE